MQFLLEFSRGIKKNDLPNTPQINTNYFKSATQISVFNLFFRLPQDDGSCVRGRGFGFSDPNPISLDPTHVQKLDEKMKNLSMDLATPAAAETCKCSQLTVQNRTDKLNSSA